MSCLCGDRGVLKVQYETGEPFDVAICSCPRGQRLRKWHAKQPDWIRQVWQIDGEHHRIAYLEDFSDDAIEPTDTIGEHHDAAYLVAGQMPKPARR